MNEVKQGQGIHAAGGQATDAPRQQFAVVAVGGNLDEVAQDQGKDDGADESGQAKLLPTLEQQHAHAGIDHVVSDQNPATFGRRQCQKAL